MHKLKIMKKIILLLTLLVVPFLIQKMYGQEEEKNEKIEALKHLKSEVLSQEKEALKKAVEEINVRIENGEISESEAKKIKEEEAKKRALNIENKLAIIENKIFLIERNGEDVITTKANKDDEDGFSIRIGGEEFSIIDWESKKNRVREIKYDRRTFSDFVFAAGLNNALIDGESINDSPYKAKGTFVELGVAWRTRVFKNSNALRLHYGVSYQFNSLNIKDDKFFVKNGNQTELQDFGTDLKKATFRRDNLVFPVHLELGPSRYRKTDKSVRYFIDNKFRVGFGGYAGFNVSTRQKLKYREDGQKIKSKTKGDFNTSDFIYGLSAYAGFGECVLYVKYDLNPIFNNASIDQRNISLGFRFDL